MTDAVRNWWTAMDRSERLQTAGILVGIVGVSLTAWRLVK